MMTAKIIQSFNTKYGYNTSSSQPDLVSNPNNTYPNVISSTKKSQQLPHKQSIQIIRTHVETPYTNVQNHHIQNPISRSKQSITSNINQLCHPCCPCFSYCCICCPIICQNLLRQNGSCYYCVKNVQPGKFCYCCVQICQPGNYCEFNQTCCLPQGKCGCFAKLCLPNKCCNCCMKCCKNGGQCQCCQICWQPGCEGCPIGCRIQCFKDLCCPWWFWGLLVLILMGSILILVLLGSDNRKQIGNKQLHLLNKSSNFLGYE